MLFIYNSIMGESKKINEVIQVQEGMSKDILSGGEIWDQKLQILSLGLSLHWLSGASDIMTVPTHGTRQQLHIYPYFLLSSWLWRKEIIIYPIPTPDYCALKNPGSPVVGPVSYMDLSLRSGAGPLFIDATVAMPHSSPLRLTGRRHSYEK